VEGLGGPLRLALIAIEGFLSVAAAWSRFGLSFVILSGTGQSVLLRLLVDHRQRWEKTLTQQGEHGADGHGASGTRSLPWRPSECNGNGRIVLAV
jgi:hypothetical protein